MKLIIELLSDMCTTSGDGHNSTVDMDVVYDIHGIPYIPAKRIKGCIREAALELRDMEIITQEQYAAGATSFYLSNAYVENYDLMVRELNSFDKRITSSQNVLEQFSYTRTQTALDIDTGVADENTLRTIRVIKKGLRFVADCKVYKDADKEVLKKSVSIVKHMGLARTRGLGMVNVTLTEDCEEKKTAISDTSWKIGEKNKIEYSIYLKSAMICKSAQGNQAVTQDYIAGSKILGLLAGKLGSDEYGKLMESGDVIVSNAYISTVNGRCVPGRVSLQKEKDTFYNTDGSLELMDMLYIDEMSGKQMSAAGIDYIDDKSCVTSVDTQITYHHQRPDDKSIGRATGADSSSFYQLASITNGQTFRGYILAGRTNAEKIIHVLESMDNVRMGYGKSSEFGAVDVNIESVGCISEDSNIVNDVIIEMVSDTILYNNAGAPTTSLDTLKEYLAMELGTDKSKLTIEEPFLCFDTVGGFNVTWGLRKPVFSAIGKGSIFRLHSDSGFDIGKMSNLFIGERTYEGFGETVVSIPAADSKVIVTKADKIINEDVFTGEQTGIIDLLLDTELKRRITAKICSLDFKKKIGTDKAALNVAISKLRAIFKCTNSYDAMLEQIEGIEDTAKKKLCEKITNLVSIDKTYSQVSVAQIQNELSDEYKRDVASSWSESEKYLYAYRQYISELKYYVKSLGGGDVNEQ